METTHWHLLLNHFPIIGTVIGTLILISGYLLKNNPVVKQTAMGVFIFSALAAIPAYLTGEGAEELVEKIPGVTEQIMDTHEDQAIIFLIAVLILGGLALITLVSSYLKSKAAAALYMVVLAASVGICFLAKQTGTTGGEIRHTEIRSGFTDDGKYVIEQNHDQEKEDD
ncbi:hypothetical protein [Negadavirga shengliensis]|uniref:DUF2231 domain-containing protein n=1 Tax=Negadavirga shengliensis TaxID=1389218 RepID=A0ABV9SWK0_9BACT